MAGCMLWTTAVVLALAIASTNAAVPPYVICLAATRSANTTAASCTSLLSTLSYLSSTLRQASCSGNIPPQLGSSGPPGPPSASTSLIFACLNTTSFSTYARLTLVTWGITTMGPSSTFLQRFDARYTGSTPPLLWLYYSNVSFPNMPSTLTITLSRSRADDNNLWAIAYYREIFQSPPPPIIFQDFPPPPALPPLLPGARYWPPSPPEQPSFPDAPSDDCRDPTPHICNGTCYETCKTGQAPRCSDQGASCCPAATPVPCADICLAPDCLCCLQAGQPSCCTNFDGWADYAPWPPEPSPVLDGTVRLIDEHGSIVNLALEGAREYSGRLVMYSGRQRGWGTVCDDNFNSASASVACRQLGLQDTGATYQSVIKSELFSARLQMEVFFDGYSCLGSEARLTQCADDFPTQHDCAHTEDVILSCQPLGCPSDFPLACNGTCYGDSNCTVGQTLFCSASSGARCCLAGFTVPCGDSCCRDECVVQNGVATCSDGCPSDYPLACNGTCYSNCDGGLTTYCSASNAGQCCPIGTSVPCGDTCCRDECVMRNGVGTCSDVLLDGTVRLVGLDGSGGNVTWDDAEGFTGRLEMYSGQKATWGTVCNDNFDSASASVACRQLGLRGTGATYQSASDTAFYDAQSPADVFFDGFSCSGSEARLTQCANKFPTQEDCSHTEDVILSCQPLGCPSDYPIACNGTCYGNCTGGLTPYCSANYAGQCCPIGTSVPCGDTCCRDECVVRNGVGTCSDVLLDGTVRLVGLDGSEGNVIWEDAEGFTGRLEMYSGQQAAWGTVCDDNFNSASASVACRQLGLRGTGATYQSASDTAFYDAQSPADVFFDGFSCSGSEARLTQCANDFPTQENCAHTEDVILSCQPLGCPSDYPLVCNGTCYGNCTGGLTPYCSANNAGQCCPIGTSVPCGDTCCRDECVMRNGVGTCSDVLLDGTVRLVGLDGSEGNVIWEDAAGFTGRLEMYSGQQAAWGTVCNDNFDSASASVACRQLGLRGTGATYQSASDTAFYDARSPADVFFDGFSCSGRETRLTLCANNFPTQQDCDHLEDIILSCQPLECTGDYPLACNGTCYGNDCTDGRLAYCSAYYGARCCPAGTSVPCGDTCCRDECVVRNGVGTCSDVVV